MCSLSEMNLLMAEIDAMSLGLRHSSFCERMEPGSLIIPKAPTLSALLTSQSWDDAFSVKCSVHFDSSCNDFRLL